MLFVCTKEGLIIPVLLSHQVYSSLQDRYAGNLYNPIALLIHLTVQGQAGFEWDFLAGICGGT